MAQNFDAFTEGVGLGGIRTKNEIRVLLCYLLSGISTEISKSGLNEVLQSLQAVNFFETNSALASLAEAGLVTVTEHDEDEYFTLTEAGREFAGRLDTELPLTLRENVVKAAVGMAAREKMRGSTDVEIVRLRRGYHVVLTVSDHGEVMLRTTLYAADSLQAQALGDAFLNAPEKLYGAVIDTLTNG